MIDMRSLRTRLLALWLMLAARARIYVPEGWQPDMDYPDVHEWSEALGWIAEEKENEICELYEKEFDERLEVGVCLER